MALITSQLNQQSVDDDQPPQNQAPATPAPPAFSDLGTVFNDASRFLLGGLWQNVVEEGGQGNGSIVNYTADLTKVGAGITAEINAGNFAGDQLTHAQAILSDIDTALSAAASSVNGGGDFGSVANAEAALRTSHLDILNIVNSDPALSALATQNGANGFLAAPSTLPDGVTAKTAPHANFADIGAIFNDAANRILGGVNTDNAGDIKQDVNTAIHSLKSLMHANPELFGGLTGVHADAVLRQLQLERTYIKEAGINPDAGRGSNDNFLDIIDIVQGDTNLANMANQGGVSGFTPFGDFLNPTPAYQDNDAQTAFWANFIAQSNSLGQQAINLVGSNDQQAIDTLINDLNAFQKNVTDFDAAQGGIFGARFDNELLGKTSTLGAEVSKMIEGLHTGNAALVAAAADQMHNNAADVGGNNIPVTGGTYNGDGLTVADVLSTATSQPAVAAPDADDAPAAAPAPTAPPADADDTPAPPPAPAAAAGDADDAKAPASPPAATAGDADTASATAHSSHHHTNHHGGGATADASSATTASDAGTAPADAHHAHSHMADAIQHLHHIWG